MQWTICEREISNLSRTVFAARISRFHGDAIQLNASKSPRPVKEDQKLASYIAMVVRNAMEDFHCEHLTDDEMKELNPIIRNAICTALHAFNCYEQFNAAASFVDFNLHMIPTYWEPPELLDDYLEMWDRET